jgi:hypothetical protein
MDYNSTAQYRKPKKKKGLNLKLYLKHQRGNLGFNLKNRKQKPMEIHINSNTQHPKVSKRLEKKELNYNFKDCYYM